jgi:hypothetical protein
MESHAMEPNDHPLPRRAFLARAAAIGVTGAAALGQAPQARAGDGLDRITPFHFIPQIGTTVRTRTNANTIFLRIVAVEDRRSEAAGTLPSWARAPFAVMFEKLGSARMPQGTYLVSHPRLGRLPLFLVPIGAADGPPRYEAVFG